MLRPFSLLDWFVVIYYLLALATLAISLLRSDMDRPGYFTSRRRWGWVNIGASLFTISLLVELVLIFWVAMGFNGQHAGLLAWFFIATFFLYAWSIWPRWRPASGSILETLFPEAFPRILRVVVTMVFVLSFTVVKIYIIIVAGSYLFGSGAHTFALLMLLVAGLVVVVGGYHAIVRMQVLQNGVILTGLLSLIIWIWFSENGLELLSNLIRNHMPALQASAGADDALSWSSVLGLPIVVMWFLGGEYATEHRFLAINESDHVRAGLLFSAALRIIFAALLLFPVLLNFASDSLLNTFWSDLQNPVVLPTGLQGLFFVTLLAILFSSLSHSLSSGGRLITFEIYRVFQPHATESELTLIGRLSTTSLVLFGLILVPYLQLQVISLDLFLKIIPAYISPPFLAFLLITQLQKGPVKQSMWFIALLALALGVLKSVTDYLPVDSVAKVPVLDLLHKIHFLQFAVLLFIATFSCMFILRWFDLRFSKKLVNPFSFRSKSFTISDTRYDGLSKTFRWHMGVTFLLFLAITSLWLIYFLPLK